MRASDRCRGRNEQEQATRQVRGHSKALSIPSRRQDTPSMFPRRLRLEHGRAIQAKASVHSESLQVARETTSE